MKSGQIIVAFLVVAVLLFGAGIVYKLSHRGSQPQSTAVAPTSEPQADNRPQVSNQPAPRPVMPAGQDLIKSGQLNPIFYLQVKMRALATGLNAAFNRRFITLGDMEKLIFDVNSTDPYGVFNPSGKVAFYPGAWPDQSLIDMVTTKKGTPLIYNLRRTTDRYGKITDSLYAIIPNIAPQNCGTGGGAKTYKLTENITVEPDNHTIVEDPPGMPPIQFGCIQTPDGKSAWMYRLKLRAKGPKPTDVWGSHN